MASGEDEFREGIFADDAFNFPAPAVAGTAGGDFSTPAPAVSALSTLKRFARGAAVRSVAAALNEAREGKGAHLRQFPYADYIDDEAMHLLDALGFLATRLCPPAPATVAAAALAACGT